MKKLTILLLALIMSYGISAQVGINTANPKATLDVDIQPAYTLGDLAGIAVPHLSATNILAMDTTILNPSTLVWATLTSGEINRIGFWYYKDIVDKWEPLPVVSTPAIAAVGDVKHSIKTTDHKGWYLLDGRAVSLLSTTAQANAVLLGFVTNLPDASGRFLKGKGASDILGNLGGLGNTIAMKKANFPNYTITGKTYAQAFNHDHTFLDNNVTNVIGGTSNTHYGEAMNDRISDAGGGHTHSYKVTTLGKSVPISIIPSSLVTKAFIYLGL